MNLKNLVSTVVFLVLAVFSIQCANPKSKKKKKEVNAEVEEVMHNKPNTYVLVHSAWLGGWQWGTVAKPLRKKGHLVIAPDLPGHGQDKTAPGDITMADYVKTIVDILDLQEDPVILVGHSFNGITVSQVAELRPKKIKKTGVFDRFFITQWRFVFRCCSGSRRLNSRGKLLSV